MSKKPTQTSSDKPTEKAELSQSNSPSGSETEAKSSASSPAQNPSAQDQKNRSPQNSSSQNQHKGKPEAGISQSKSAAGASQTKPATGASQPKSGAGASQAKPAAGASQAKPGAGASQAKPGAGASQSKPQPKPSAPTPKSAADQIAAAQASPSQVIIEKRSGGFGTLLLAIIFSAAVGGALFYFGNLKFLHQQEKIDALKAQMVDRQAAYQQQSKEMSGEIETATKQSTSTQNRVLELEAMISQEEQQQPDLWLLAEAQYHVQLAGRRIFIEHDIDTAIALLIDADKRIRELADPSLSVLREAIANDIASLQAMTQLDRDGLVLALSSLEDQVDDLKVGGIELPEAVDPIEAPVSTDVSDWQDNLLRSWKALSDDFVTVRRRDGKVEALMSPDQTVYLNENLKTKLLQAQMSVYRQNQDVYTTSLEQAETWLNHYYKEEDSLTISMLKEIDKLKAQDITFQPPEELKSAKMLKQLIEQRKQLQIKTSQQGAL